MNQLGNKYILNIEIKEDSIIFIVQNNYGPEEKYKLYHEQDCCEDVYLESVDSCLAKEDFPVFVLHSEEINIQTSTEDGTQTSSWYKIQTDKGYLTARFFGSSNGYYSETAQLERI